MPLNYFLECAKLVFVSLLFLGPACKEELWTLPVGKENKV